MNSSVAMIKLIRERMEPLIGARVRLRANRGRNRIVENEGILDSLYPNVFVIRLMDKRTERCVSYSYTDLLTSTVEIQLCGSEPAGIV